MNLNCQFCVHTPRFIVVNTQLRIVTWNCNGALRKKWPALEALQSDVLVVQECEDPAQAGDPAYSLWAGRYLWIGDTKNKGIGVFVGPDVQLEAADIDVAELKLFLPCLINGFPLLAVWTQNVATEMLPYIGQLWKFLQLHRTFLSDPLAMVMGDLNSNVQWDKRTRCWNHTDVVRELSAIGLHSAYHDHYGVAQGGETDPTFYLHRNIEKSYHIDYAFAGRGWDLEDVQIGPHQDWLSISDHMPFRLTARKRRNFAE